MAEIYYPFDEGAGKVVREAEWRQFARFYRPDGVLLNELDELEVFGDGSLGVAKVRAGRLFVQGHWYENPAVKSLAVTPNSSGNPRKDLIVVRLDPVANIITAARKTGTPAGSPVPPTPTQVLNGTWEVPLGVVDVDAGFEPSTDIISAGDVADDRDWSLHVEDGPGVRLARASNQNIVNNTWVSISWSVANFNDRMWTSGTDVTAWIPGYYDCSFDAAIDFDATGVRGLRFLVEGADPFTLEVQDANSQSDHRMNGSKLIPLERGWTIEAQVFQNSGGTLAAVFQENNPEFSVTWRRPL